MIDNVFFDTNILVNSFAAKKADVQSARRDTAQKLIIHGGVISVQVLNEYVQVCRKKMQLDWAQIMESLQAIYGLCEKIVPTTIETHEKAVNLSRRYGFHIYDSLMIAAALQSGCTTIYSEDMQHGQMIEGMRIENPFRAVT
jgi:predicted nucleic acid-binding protein